MIVTPGSLIRRNEVSLREQIVVNDWLEAVITFPNNLYPKDHTGKSCSFLTKRKEKGKIIFLDISGYCQRTGRNVHSLTEEGIKLAKKVFDSAEQIPGVSAVCGREEIGENAFSLKPLQYIRWTEERECSQVSLWRRLRRSSGDHSF
ncbi:MAG: N-6 DNA methylase [Sellimonas intestinalis]